jgi:hypothetical protein
LAPPAHARFAGYGSASSTLISEQNRTKHIAAPIFSRALPIRDNSDKTATILRR